MTKEEILVNALATRAAEIAREQLLDDLVDAAEQKQDNVLQIRLVAQEGR